MHNNKRGVITLVPLGNLANRLEGIASALSIATRYDKPVEILWFTAEDMSCTSERLFSIAPSIPIELVSVRQATTRDWYTLNVPSGWNLFLPYITILLSYDQYISRRELDYIVEQKPNDIERLFESNERIFLPVYHGLIHAPDMYETLVPSAEVMRSYCSSTSGWGDEVYGILLRRNSRAPENDSSAIEVFIKRMQRLIQDNERTQFYISANNIEDLERLTTLFRKHVFVPRTLPTSDTPQGIVSTYSDLLVLAATKKILAARECSMARVASKMGGVPYETLSIYSDQ